LSKQALRHLPALAVSLFILVIHMAVLFAYDTPELIDGGVRSPGPKKIAVDIDNQKLTALVDTGSDFEAMDQGLSECLGYKSNSGFLETKETDSVSVGDSLASVSGQASRKSDWQLTLTGSRAWDGQTTDPSFRIPRPSGLGSAVVAGRG